MTRRRARLTVIRTFEPLTPEALLMTSVTCPLCGQEFETGAAAGKSVRCPSCKTICAVSADGPKRAKGTSAPAGRKKRKPGAKPAAVIPPRVWAIGGGAVVLLAVVLYLAFGGRKPDAGPGGDPVARGPAADPDGAEPEPPPPPDLPVLVAPVKPGPTKLLRPADLPAADAAAWTVAPEGGVDRPADLRSEFEQVTTRPGLRMPHPVTLFAAPGAARAAVVGAAEEKGRSAFRWFQFDLRAGPKPAAEVELDGEKLQGYFRLSPSGNRLADTSARFVGSGDDYSEVVVWGPDGKTVAKVGRLDRHGKGRQTGEVTPLAFVDEDRLLIVRDGQLELREVKTDRVAAVLMPKIGQHRVPTAVSPKRTLVAVYDCDFDPLRYSISAGRGIHLFSTADGKKVGYLPLPESLAAAAPALAFAPDGKTLGCMFDERKNITDSGRFSHLVTWNLSDGKPAACVPVQNASGLHWISDRLAFVGGPVVDLDIPGPVAFLPGMPLVGDAPDGRLWTRPLRVDAGWPSPEFLARVERAKKGRAFAMGGPARVEVAAADQALRENIAPALADQLALHSVVNDPQAAFAFRLRLGELYRTEVGTVSSFGKGTVINTGTKQVTGQDATLELVAPGGKVMWRADHVFTQFSLHRGSYADLLKRHWSNVSLPHALVATNEAGRALRLPAYFEESPHGLWEKHRGYPRPPPPRDRKGVPADPAAKFSFGTPVRVEVQADDAALKARVADVFGRALRTTTPVDPAAKPCFRVRIEGPVERTVPTRGATIMSRPLDDPRGTVRCVVYSATVEFLDADGQSLWAGPRAVEVMTDRGAGSEALFNARDILPQASIALVDMIPNAIPTTGAPAGTGGRRINR